ncbi:MAG: hypothetical protein MJ107_00625 [Lachnospiraceae bacterium]|nr:hypothetical protein [Lachnospiraceae bacterium]
MDYKFRQGMTLIASLCILTVVGIVIMANWKAISRRAGKTNNQIAVSSSFEEETVVETSSSASKCFFKGNQIGSDLGAWKSDPSFFVNDFEEKTVSPGGTVTAEVSGNDISGNDDSRNAENSIQNKESDEAALDAKAGTYDSEDGLSKRDNTDN